MVEGDRQALLDPLSDAIKPVQMTPEELFDFNNKAHSHHFDAIDKKGTIFASEDPRFHHKFGRDTFINAYFIAESIKYSPQEELWKRAKRAVFRGVLHDKPISEPA